MKTQALFTLLFAIIFGFISCEKPDPVDPEDEELIVKLVYTLTADGGVTNQVFSFEDLDGEGGDEPIITSANLSANTIYTGSIELFTLEDGNLVSINPEIQEEDEDHQFFFSTDLTGVIISYSDMDADMNPIGLTSLFATAVAGTSKLEIVLKHKPEKSAAGVSGGDITNAGGSTDIEVEFDLVVE